MRAKTHCSTEPLDGAEKTCFRPALAAHVYLPSWLRRLRQNSAFSTFLLASLIAPARRFVSAVNFRPLSDHVMFKSTARRAA
jgi:hypothetical protein